MGILILEDDSNMSELIKEAIKENYSNIPIFEAADPVQALAIFQKNKFKIKYLICDYLLPIQNGKDFIDIVKDYSPQLKICVFTGDLAVTEKNIPKANDVLHKHDGISQVVDFIRRNQY